MIGRYSMQRAGKQRCVVGVALRVCTVAAGGTWAVGRQCRAGRAHVAGWVAVGLLSAWPALAQDARSARARAPVDLTGYWVTVVTEDWAWRMRTPANGDYASVPLNDDGLRMADAWTEDRDGSCLAFGAPALLRMPVRVRIEWADENTLIIESDNGMQRRTLHFGAGQASGTAPSLQGHSVAEWQIASAVVGSGATAGILTTAIEAVPWAPLEVVTTNLSPGWLRRNGVPYSDRTVLTEYFDRFDDGEDQWFTVTTIVDDPVYLTEPFVVSSNFRREPDDAAWRPLPCK